MTIADFRTYINATFTANGAGGIDGTELRDSLLEVCNRLEAQGSWSPVFSLVTNGANTVVKINDWTGGQGTKPPINVYLGSGTTYVTDINTAVNVKGATGATGVAGAVTGASMLTISASNPTNGIFGIFSNIATAARNGVRLLFDKQGLALWRIGMPDGVDDAFMIEGYGGATYPEYVRIGANGYFGLGGSRTTPGYPLHVNADNPATGLVAEFKNTHNTTGRLGTKIQLNKTGVSLWRLGIEDGDATNGFVFNSFGGGAYPEVMRITDGGAVGIGVTLPTETLDVSGRLRSKGIVTAGTLPTVVKGAGLGGSGTASMVSNSTDMAGGVTLLAASGASASSILATVTFVIAYGRAPRILLTPTSLFASVNNARVYAAATTTGFTINCNSLSPVDLGVSMEFTYLIIG